MKNRISNLTYFKRTLIMLGLIFVVIFVQTPIQILSIIHHPSIISLVVGGVIYLVFFGFAIWGALIAYKSVYKQTNHGLNLKDWLLIAKAYVLFFVIEIVLSFLNQLVYAQKTTENNKNIMAIFHANPVILILMCFTMTFFSPILEELVFRGYLIKGFFPNFKPLIPMLISGFLFSLCHDNSNPISFLIYMSLGMILSYVYLKQDKIEVSIGLHFLNNLIATTLMLIGMLIG